jgi:hypothetical protein
MLDDRGSTDSSFLIHPFSIQPGEAEIVGDQLALAFERAKTRSPRPAQPIAPAASIDGSWDVEIAFTVGTARHRFDFDGKAGAWHRTLFFRSPLSAKVHGDRVEITSQHRYEGTNLTYRFVGTVGADGRSMIGEVELGSTGQAAIGPINMKEYGNARWTAVKSMVAEKEHVPSTSEPA